MKIIRTALVFCATLLALAQPAQAQCPYDFSTNDGTVTIDEYTGQAYNVTIPGTIDGLPVTSIADGAFGNDENLYTVIIPPSVTNIGNYVFAGFNALVAIYVDEGNLYYSSLNGVLFNYSQTTLIEYPTELPGGYTVPSTVTNIGDYAFATSLALTSITIPASVTSLGEGAFVNSALESAYFEGNAPSADSTVFSGYLFNYSATVYYLPWTTGWDDFSANTGNPVVLWNPLIQASGTNFGAQNNRFGFNITGTNDFTVVVVACTNLASPVWTPLQTVTLNNGTYYFSDPDWSNYPARFYGLSMP